MPINVSTALDFFISAKRYTAKRLKRLVPSVYSYFLLLFRTGELSVWRWMLTFIINPSTAQRKEHSRPVQVSQQQPVWPLGINRLLSV